jgi:predicted DNA-binding transcriptional regulator AlpA
MDTQEKLLTITEAAEMLNVPTDYLYHHWDEFPFAFKLSKRKLRFSLHGVLAYIEEQVHARRRPDVSAS